MKLSSVLVAMQEHTASDAYISVDAPVMLRVDGRLKPLSSPLSLAAINVMLNSAMNEEQKQQFITTREANFAVKRSVGRFRISAYWQRDMPSMVIRRIETEIPRLSSLGTPVVLEELAMQKRGLVLVVGATGSGKSTTMAAMMGFRNHYGQGHILTVEDPIEFVHEHQQCIVSQREIGIDTQDYETALKNALRQAPDMVVIGEIRTPETMNFALQFAETGHLCLATLHANNAYQALERALHLMPKAQRETFLFDLSMNLKGVIAQQLVPGVNGVGRHGAFELLINNAHVAELIRNGELHALKKAMLSGGHFGMQTFDQSLYALYVQGSISEDEALRHADSANELKLMIKTGAKHSAPGSALDHVRIERAGSLD